MSKGLWVMCSICGWMGFGEKAVAHEKACDLGGRSISTRWIEIEAPANVPVEKAPAPPSRGKRGTNSYGDTPEG